MKKFYYKQEIEEIKETIDIREIMRVYGLDTEKENIFYCPNPEHNDIHPSAQYKNDNGFCNCLVCFSCPDIDAGECKVFDNIQVWAFLNGLDTRKDFVRILNELVEFGNSNKCYLEKKPEKVKEEEKEAKKNNAEEIYKKQIEFKLNTSKTLHELHLEHKYFLDKYLSMRCVNIEKLKPFLEQQEVEIRHNYYKNVNSCMFYCKKQNLILQRQIEDYLQQTNNAAHGKFNAGKANYCYFKTAENNKDLLIFEGIYDMLSFMSYNMEKEDILRTDYICLNSVNNLSLLTKEQTKIFNNYDNIGIFTDNDDAGVSCSEKIKYWCELIDYTGTVETYLPFYKDWNLEICCKVEEERQVKEEKRKLKNSLGCQNIYAIDLK